MPKEKTKEIDCRTHKMLLGLGIIIFSFFLFVSSSRTALETNLNWPAAFFILGILVIIKGFMLACYKK